MIFLKTSLNGHFNVLENRSFPQWWRHTALMDRTNYSFHPDWQWCIYTQSCFKHKYLTRTSNKHLRPGWTCPSKASLQTTSLPTWQCRSSTHHWQRWTSCKQWPLVPSTSLGSFHPGEQKGRQREKGEMCSCCHSLRWFLFIHSSSLYPHISILIGAKTHTRFCLVHPSHFGQTSHLAPPPTAQCKWRKMGLGFCSYVKRVCI